MSKNKIMGLVLGAVLIFAAVVYFMMSIDYKNQEIDLRTQANAQQKTNEAVFDKVWKVIQQKASITDKYAGDFKSAFSDMMNARYQGEAGGNTPMMKWIHEQNPTLSVDMYKDLSAAIESNRAEFLRVQERLNDIKREHDRLRLKFPGSFFLSGIKELDIKIVTSSKTEQSFATGKEDDVDLFGKK